MANFTISTPLSSEENSALRERINKALAPLGYYVKPGPRGKEEVGGGIGYFLKDIADGDAIAVKVDDYEHTIVATWLARQIETLAASDPDDTTLLDWLTQLQDALADAFNRRH